MFIYPYSMASQSVEQLKGVLDAKVIKKKNSKFRGDPDKKVINWGSISRNPEVEKCQLLNHPLKVRVASNKLKFFNYFVDKNVNIPAFTTDVDVVDGWVQDGKTVVAREILNGKSGEGIVLIDTKLKWEDYDENKALLFTQYIPKKDEYRVHVFNGEIVDIKRKGHMHGAKVDYRIRTHKHGFIYLNTEGEEVQEGVREQALLAINSLELDFGAVDVIYNKYREKAYVLEVNTAPGIEGSTVLAYSQAIRKWKDQ